MDVQRDFINASILNSQPDTARLSVEITRQLLTLESKRLKARTKISVHEERGFALFVCNSSDCSVWNKTTAIISKIFGLLALCLINKNLIVSPCNESV